MYGVPKAVSFPNCKVVAKCVKENPNVSTRSSQQVASEIHLPKTGCTSEVTALRREEVSAQRACHSWAVLQMEPLSSSCFKFFWAGTAIVLPISLFPSRFYLSCVFTWDRAAEFLLSGALPKLNQQPLHSGTVPGLLASMWQPDCQLSGWLIWTGLQDPGSDVPREEGQRTLSLIPALSKLLWSFRKAIRVSHQFLYQQNKNNPGVVVFNFVFFYEVLWRWEQLHLFA